MILIERVEVADSGFAEKKKKTWQEVFGVVSLRGIRAFETFKGGYGGYQVGKCVMAVFKGFSSWKFRAARLGLGGKGAFQLVL